MILLYRGHKHESYLTTTSQGLCFSERKDLANSYGNGSNDAGNPLMADGFVTTVEFHGQIADVNLHGLNLFKSFDQNLLRHDAVRCKDGVVVVFSKGKLLNPKTEKAIPNPATGR